MRTSSKRGLWGTAVPEKERGFVGIEEKKKARRVFWHRTAAEHRAGGLGYKSEHTSVSKMRWARGTQQVAVHTPLRI